MANELDNFSHRKTNQNILNFNNPSNNTYYQIKQSLISLLFNILNIFSILFQQISLTSFKIVLCPNHINIHIINTQKRTMVSTDCNMIKSFN